MSVASFRYLAAVMIAAFTADDVHAVSATIVCFCHSSITWYVSRICTLETFRHDVQELCVVEAEASHAVTSILHHLPVADFLQSVCFGRLTSPNTVYRTVHTPLPFATRTPFFTHATDQ